MCDGCSPVGEPGSQKETLETMGLLETGDPKEIARQEVNKSFKCFDSHVSYLLGPKENNRNQTPKHALPSQSPFSKNRGGNFTVALPVLQTSP